MKLHLHIKILFFLSCLLVIFFTIGLYLSLNSTLNTTLTNGDINAFTQLYYNYYHGRPFQVSHYNVICSNSYTDQAFLNVLVLHSYFLTPLLSLPFLFTDWAGTTYAISLSFNMIFTFFYTYKIIKHHNPYAYITKFYLSIFILFAGGFLHYCFIHAVPTFMAFPLVLMAYYYFITNQKILYYLINLLICLLQDDLNTMVITGNIFIFIFKKEQRSYAVPPLVFATLFFFSWNLIFQKMIRSESIAYKQTMLSDRLDTLFSIFLQQDLFTLLKTHFSGFISSSITGFHLGWVLIFSIIILFLTFDLTKKFPKAKLLAFLFLIPAPYWVYNLVQFGFIARYAILINSILYLALLLVISRIELPKILAKHKLIWLYLLLLFSVPLHFLVTDIIPYPVRTWGKSNLTRDYLQDHLYGFLGIKGSVDTSYRAVVKSNREVIETINTIPKSESVSFWANGSIDLFVISRNDIWLFPYYYNQTDYLVIQKDANFLERPVEDLATISDRKKVDTLRMSQVSIGDSFNASSRHLVMPLIEQLVNEQKTHEIVKNTNSVLVLKRKEHYQFPMPSFTMGFGWFKI